MVLVQETPKRDADFAFDLCIKHSRNFPGGPVAKTLCPSTGSQGS